MSVTKICSNCKTWIGGFVENLPVQDDIGTCTEELNCWDVVDMSKNYSINNSSKGNICTAFNFTCIYFKEKL